MPWSTIIRDPRGAVALIFVAALLWGSAFPAIKRGYLLLEIDPTQGAGAALLFAALRFLLAGALLLGGAAIFRLGVFPKKQQLLGLLVLGVVQTTFQYATFYLGMVYTTGVKAAIIVASGSFFMALLSPFVYRNDRLTVWRLFGLAIGFGGVVLANVVRAGERDAAIEWVGDGLILATGLCSAIASLLSKRLVQQVHPVVVNGYQVTLGAIVLSAIVAPFATAPTGHVSFEVAALTLYLAVVTAVAFTLYYVVLAHHDLSKVAVYRFLIPICATTLSAWLIPGESLGWSLAVAAVLVVSGIWCVNRP